MNEDSSNEISERIKAENAIEEELLNKYKNFSSLCDSQNDILFKILFGQDGNKDKTISLLNSIISNDETPKNNNESPEISEIEFYELPTSRYSENEKTSIIDLHAKDNKNNIDYFVELQVLKDKNRLNRTEYYNFKVVQTFLEKGKPYSTNRKVYLIHILDFNLFKKRYYF